jgi:squalene cyclase
MRKTLIGALLSASVAIAPASAQDARRRDAGDMPTEVTAASIRAAENGLKWLADHQNKDGSWYCDIGFKLNETFEVTTAVEEQEQNGGGHVGVTALAGMAFMAGGHLPGRGPYGRTVEKALEYVLSCVRSDGYITDNETRMYSHAFATLFLAEIYGMTRRENVKEKLQMAVDLVVQSQNDKGSWRYLPFAQDSDMSITVCQVMALRAARNGGIRVPRSTIDRAIKYVQGSAITAGRYRGGFKYQERPIYQTRSSYSLTAAGIVTLYSAGVYDHESIKRGLEFLKDDYTNVSSPLYRNHYFFFYGNYYAVQAMYIAGGAAWEWYFPRVREDLIESQQGNGAWSDNVGEAFATAMACVILEIPYNYLPIFQR